MNQDDTMDKAKEKPADSSAQEPAADDAVRKTEQQDSADAEQAKTPEEALKAQLADLEKKAEESEAKRLLALAEMDNQRKRFAKEMENLRYNVTQDTLFPFLQVFDHFSMAVAASAGAASVESLQKGMEMIQQEFDKAFSDLGVEKIDANGKEFDPQMHEAVAQEPSDTVPAGTVLRQWNMGYRMGDRLLKPAVVVVSSGPEQKKKE